MLLGFNNRLDETVEMISNREDRAVDLFSKLRKMVTREEIKDSGLSKLKF